MTQAPFTSGERQALLARYFPAYRRWQELDYQFAVAAGNPPEDLSREYDELGRTLADLRAEYRAGLPFVPVSRCPFSRQVVYHSLDPFGIDGLWWNYTAPVRPVENLPVTFHALTGAISLDGPPGNAPFLCIPGPGAPYVLPAVLGNNDITAVISSLPIGSHTGYIITYFTASETAAVPRPNSWGMDHWELLDRSGTFRWGEGAAGPADFELAPWIEKKKLLWIGREDRTLTLQSGLAGCPYTGPGGPRQIQRVREGTVQLSGQMEG